MAQSSETIDENSAHKNRQLTIGLGSALDAFAESDEVDGLITNLSTLGEERYRERLREISITFKHY